MTSVYWHVYGNILEGMTKEVNFSLKYLAYLTMPKRVKEELNSFQ